MVLRFNRSIYNDRNYFNADKKMIEKKFFILIVCIFFTLQGLSGCTSEEINSNSNELSTEKIDLKQVVLKQQDLPSNFTLLNENHSKKPSTQVNQTGNGITWYINERYDATYYDTNSTNGVMQSLLKLDSKNNAMNLTRFSKDNLISYGYSEETIEPIGDGSYLLYKPFNQANSSYTYYTLLFSVDTIFVALGGSSPNQSYFIDYATTIEQRIIDNAS